MKDLIENQEILSNSSYSVLIAALALSILLSKILSCSSIVKFCYLKSGSTNSVYISNISLWLINPGLVRFIVPVSFLIIISNIIG